MECAGRA